MGVTSVTMTQSQHEARVDPVPAADSDIPDFWIWGGLVGSGEPKIGPWGFPRDPQPARNVKF